MNLEQPSLGRIGVDSFSFTCDWHWEGGWTVVTSSRLSGSAVFRQERYEALGDEELLQVLLEVAATHLGLV